MGVVVLGRRDHRLPLDVVLVVVEVAVVGRHAEIVAQVLGPGHLLAGEQGLVLLLAVARADDPDRIVRLVELLQGQRQGLDGGGGSLLDEEIARLAFWKA